MSKPLKRVLHIFRRDLRLQDNTALLSALEAADTVIPCFIFDPRQLHHNPYAGNHALSFMAHSLSSLHAQLREKKSQLYFFEGEAEKVVATLINQLSLDGISFNRDYTPFSRERDTAIAALAMNHGLQLIVKDDALLHAPETVHKPDGKPYTVFTPFYKRALTLPVALPQKNNHDHYYQALIPGCDEHTLPQLLKKHFPAMPTQGGRESGYQRLRDIVHLDDYAKARDFPAMQSTSLLSAHHKFGTISVRETHARVSRYLGSTHSLIAELHWRDFFTHIGFHFPHVFTGCFHPEYDELTWSTDERLFHAWCDGLTGFPLVDAGMRELKTTGYMHNRVRMVTASFLIKDCQLDWRWGEKHFAALLADYDPAVNNGNWQWAASTGCDAQPYFRVFNPWRQQQRFDPDCLYIKQWIPELARYTPKVIHGLEKETPAGCNYPRPLLDHAKASRSAIERYKRIQAKHRGMTKESRP